MAQMVKNLPETWETQVQSLVRKIPWRRERPPTPVFLPEGFHRQKSLVGHNSWCHKALDMTECNTHSLKTCVTKCRKQSQRTNCEIICQI